MNDSHKVMTYLPHLLCFKLSSTFDDSNKTKTLIKIFKVKFFPEYRKVTISLTFDYI